MMKIKFNLINVLAVYLLLVLFSAGTAAAGWRIDGARFSQSAHGDMACVDCHSDIQTNPTHPQPANVRKSLTDFFEPETCLECHDDIQGQIEDDAEHGGKKVDNVQAFMNCINCHDPHYEGAPEADAAKTPVEFADTDKACMACHQAVSPDDPEAVSKNREFCFSCHDSSRQMGPSVPVMNLVEYDQTVHAKLDCMTCHPMADQYGHHEQVSGDCTRCHTPHKESVAHEAHAGVACQACHMDQIFPVRDETTNEVIWDRVAHPGTVSTLHTMIKPTGEGCLRCHYSGNTIGAAAMVLPPKSVMCMPCHTATLSASDTTTVVSLLIFGFGMLGFMSLWFSGTFAGSAGGGMIGNGFKALTAALAALASPRIGKILSTLWYDVFLQRRLYERSPRRWFIHALIFWPFVIRFVWGVAALVTTNWVKGWSLAWALIDKNHPVTALLFDVTGLCLVVGIALALMRGFEADKTRTPGLPGQDRVALFLIGGIALVGFVLEGMRIAMTGAQDPACWAIVGYAISRLFAGMSGLSEMYGYLWYLHAILTGAFVAYLPFSKMMHIIMSPVILAMNAAIEKEHH